MHTGRSAWTALLFVSLAAGCAGPMAPAESWTGPLRRIEIADGELTAGVREDTATASDSVTIDIVNAGPRTWRFSPDCRRLQRLSDSGEWRTPVESLRLCRPAGATLPAHATVSVRIALGPDASTGQHRIQVEFGLDESGYEPVALSSNDFVIR